MTKICGVVGGREDIDPASVLRCMYDASWHDNYIRREVWHDSRAGLGHFNVGAVNTEPQPSFSADGDRAIVYCGKIFDYASLKNDLVSRGVHFELENNDAEFMLHFLDHGGRDRLSRLNGIFSLACWDSRQKKLILINDRYGYRPLYYHHNPQKGVFVFSSDLRGVVASGMMPLEINWEACSTFLHFGHYLGDETSFRNTFVLPPASVMVYFDNQIHIDTYWNPCDIQIHDRMNYQEASEGSAHYFSQSIKRINNAISSPKIVFLSGGLDSRRIAAELKRQDGIFTTYTTRGFNTLTSNRLLAAQVAAALGVTNTFINLPSYNFLKTYWPRCNALLDYETNLHQWMLPLVESLPDDKQVFFDGIAGDILFNCVLRVSNFNTPEKYAHAQNVSEQELAELIIPKPVNLLFLNSEIRHKLSRDAVLSQIQTELRKLQNTPSRLTLFYLLNRTRRAIALSPLKLITLKGECCLPYLDKDFFEFMLRIPPVMKITHTLRKDTILREYPELRKVDFTTYVNPDARAAHHAEDIRYYPQKRWFMKHNIYRHYLKNNWVFNNCYAAPRIAKDILISRWRPHHVSTTFSAAFLVWYEWLESYFSHLDDRKQH